MSKERTHTIYYCIDDTDTEVVISETAYMNKLADFICYENDEDPRECREEVLKILDKYYSFISFYEDDEAFNKFLQDEYRDSAEYNASEINAYSEGCVRTANSVYNSTRL